MRYAFLTVVFVLTAVTTAQAQGSLSIEQVKDGLYSISGSGGNVGIRVTTEGVILIDDKFPQNFAEIQELVSQVSDQPVRYVLNTHHHGDHSGGNIEYINISEIIAHQNARDNMVRVTRTPRQGWSSPIRLLSILVALKSELSIWAVDTQMVTR